MRRGMEEWWWKNESGGIEEWDEWGWGDGGEK